MRRVLCVHLPFWAVERATRRRPGEPSSAVVVVAARAQRQSVEHACVIARRAGVRPGMTLAHARALVGTRPLIVVPHDPARDAACLDALARWCQRWTPVARGEPPDGLLLDITGCVHLFGGERALIESLRTSLGRLGVTARLAVSSTVGAAWGAARFGSEALAIIPPGHEARALGDLPAGALRLEPEVLGSLEEIGVRTVGQILDLPRMALPSRYGPDLLQRLDQALGDVPEGVHGIAVDEPPRAVLELSGGTTQWEAVGEAVRRLIGEVCVRLRRREAGVWRLEAHFTRLDASPACLVVEVSRPTRARSHLWALIRPRLERLHLGSGIERIEMVVSRMASIVHEQIAIPGMDNTHDARGTEAQVAGTLEVLASRLGSQRLLRSLRRASHRPERGFAMVPALDPCPGDGSVGIDPPVLPRPTCLLDPPEPVRVVAMCPEGPVLRVWWRGVERTIATSVGPERLAGEWWVAREGARDYFRVQDDRGLWLWLFRESASAQWRIHGVWA